MLTGKRDDRKDYQRLLSDIRRYRKEGRRVAVVVSRLDGRAAVWSASAAGMSSASWACPPIPSGKGARCPT